MKQPTLFDVPPMAPSKQALINAFKKKCNIWTVRAAHLAKEEGRWTAMKVPDKRFMSYQIKIPNGADEWTKQAIKFANKAIKFRRKKMDESGIKFSPADWKWMCANSFCDIHQTMVWMGFQAKFGRDISPACDSSENYEKTLKGRMEI